MPCWITCIEFICSDLHHVTCFAADILGFKTYPPAYLSPQVTGKNLLVGANFGSAAAGYDDNTAIINVN